MSPGVLPVALNVCGRHEMSVVKALSLDAVTFVEIDLHNRIAFDLVSNGCEIWIAVIV
jgi:hypothetical protein